MLVLPFEIISQSSLQLFFSVLLGRFFFSSEVPEYSLYHFYSLSILKSFCSLLLSKNTLSAVTDFCPNLGFILLSMICSFENILWIYSISFKDNVRILCSCIFGRSFSAIIFFASDFVFPCFVKIVSRAFFVFLSYCERNSLRKELFSFDVSLIKAD